MSPTSSVSDSLAQRLRRLNERIAQAAVRAGRSPEDIQLVAVTKNCSAELVAELYQLGLRQFGENRHQEAAQKVAQLPADIKWHFIGQLQSNKARAVSAYASTIHALDRLSLLKALAAAPAPQPREVFIQVNLTDDPRRGGAAPEALPEFAAAVAACPAVRLLGIMAVADPQRPAAAQFERVRQLSEELRQLAPQAHYISAGMSNDFEEAIAFGATHLRIGSQITH